MNKTPTSFRTYLKSSAMILLIASTGSLLSCAVTDENGEVVDRECRAEEHLGSRIQKRLCMTKEQWAVVDERNARLLEANAKDTQDGLRQALIMGSQVEPRGFDSP